MRHCITGSRPCAISTPEHAPSRGVKGLELQSCDQVTPHIDPEALRARDSRTALPRADWFSRK